MNITDNLIRIKEGKDNIIKSLKNKGVSINDNTLINEIPTIIDNAEIGGGGDTPIQPDVPELTPKYDGATVFRINVPTDNYEFAINLCNDASRATYDVDWGDGSLEYGKTTDEQHHIYSKKGTYDVNIYNLSKDITLGGSSSIGDEYRDSYNSLITSTMYPFLFNNSNNDIYTSFVQIINDFIITNILIGDKISEIQSNAFNNCSSLTSIIIPEGVTSIGQYAFENCRSLTSIIIPEGVTSIGYSAFKNCSSLTSVTIPNSVTSIGSNAFLDCSSLTSVTIPNSVTSIGNSAFENCSSLTSIIIPERVTSIGKSAFASCSSLTSITIPNSVKSIGQYAFENCSSLTSIIIPEGVTSIGYSAFNNCSSLTSIIIPEGVTSIEESAFNNCSSLTSIIIPERVTSIGKSAFNNCSSLTSIIIPEGVTSIESSAFASCYSLTSVTIPNSVKSIGSNAFSKCYSLQSINCLNQTSPTIKTDSFTTTYLYYPQRILYIPKDSVGYDSGNFKTYLIDKGWELRFIEDKDNTTKESILKFKTKNNIKIKIPYICEGKLIREEFVDGEYIYTYDKEITQLSGLLYCQEILIDITIPNTVKNLGRATFCNSPYFYKATEIIVPEGIEYIGELCYYSKANSKFNKVVLPSTIKEIKADNFKFRSGGTLICKAMTAPNITNTSFSLDNIMGGTKIKLRVPEGSSGYEEGQWVSNYVTLEYVPLSEL